MKETNEKPVQSIATVLVNGISIFDYNREENCVDFGFLKGVVLDDHPYRIRIFNFGGIFWSSEDFQARYFENSITRIKTTSRKDVQCYINPNGKEHDDQDYRWILNLKKDLYDGKDVEIKANTPDPLFSKLSIEDAVFYTYLKSTTKARIIEQNTGETHELRKLGRVVGADLKCDPKDNIEISFEWLENAHAPIKITLFREQGPFVISVDYKCDRSTAEGSDFRFIYDVIVPPTKEIFDVMFDGGEENWGFRSIVGNRESKKYIHECDVDKYKDDFPPALRTLFNCKSDAENSGYEPHDYSRLLAGEYACQGSNAGGDKGVPFPLPS